MAYDILVVDDEPGLREMVQGILAGAGYTVRLAGTCAQALQQSRGKLPDGVLLDVMLPDGDGFALLEMKQKDGAQQRKRSLRVSREEAEQLIQGRYSLLLDLDDPFAAECHSLLETLFYRPKVLIEYRRTAYLLPTNSIRITFDREIRAQTGHLDLFADPFLGAPVFPGFHTILEVKYNHFLPSYIRDALRSVDASECSASKYGMSRAGSAFHSV